MRRAIFNRNMMATRAWGKMQPRNYEGVTISDQSRFEDEPEPTNDEQIGKNKLNKIDDFCDNSEPLFEAPSILRVQKL